MTKQEIQEKALTLTTEHRSRIRRWVRALRSKRYEKTEGTLRDAGGWCCLGVACDVYRKATGLGTWEVDSDGVINGAFKTENERGHGNMPNVVTEWFGLGGPHRGDPFLILSRMDKDGDTTSYASTLNDEKGYSLARIGDRIERSYLPTRARRARRS